MPLLELFDCLVKEYEILRVWNDEIRLVLNKTECEEVSNVTY
jgi:hypothetical protein